MRLTCLEMEKVRKTKEKESSMRRVQQIETRFEEIEEEKSQLLSALEAHNGDTRPVILPRGNRSDQAGGERARSFKIRY